MNTPTLPPVLTLIESVQRSVVSRTSRRVTNLTVELADDAVVLRGRANSFHVKQLALHGAREAHPDGRLVNAITVAVA